MSVVKRGVMSILLLFLFQPAVAAQHGSAADFRLKYEIQDHWAALGEEFAPPSSNWIETEKKIYRERLEKEHYDVLVVPFQSDDQPVDLTSRKLMTYKLASEIARRTDARVAPVHLVYRALGNTARYYETEPVYELASALGATRVIWGFAGYSKTTAHPLSFHFTVISENGNPLSANLTATHRTWSGMPLGCAQFPFEAFDSKIDEVLELTGFTKAPAPPDAENTYTDLQLPETPDALIHTPENRPLVKAVYLQLMGLLTPAAFDHEIQKDFFIRSLAHVWRTGIRSPEINLLRARAYLYLNHRPLAVKIMSAAKRPEAMAFHDYLNGNLTEQDADIERISSPLKKLMATLEKYHLQEMAGLEKTDSDVEKILAGLPEEWRYLVGHRLVANDIWNVQSNIPLNAYLDIIYPIDEITMEALLQSAAASGELEQKAISFNLLFADHIDKVLQKEGTTLSAGSGPGNLSDYDFLLLLSSIGETNLQKSVYYFFRVQGQSEKALPLVNAYLTTLQGHPAFHYWKAIITLDLLYEQRSLTEREKSDLARQFLSDGYSGLWWMGQQDSTLSTATVAHNLNFIDRNRDEYKLSHLQRRIPGGLINTYIKAEFPPSGSFVLQFPHIRMEEKLELIHLNLRVYEDILKRMLAQSTDSARRVVENQTRFQGNPRYSKIRALMCKRLGMTEALEKVYLQGIREDALFWDNYEELGRLYAQQGDYEKAKSLYMSYPPFAAPDSEDHTVALSNESYIAGCDLFWRGAYDAARPLYTISADLDTGSDASLSSAARLNIIDKNFPDAAMYFLRRARRYNSQYAFRDYMSLLHIMGQADVAWSLFDGLLGRFSTPQIWTSAFVGHRLAATGMDDLEAWLEKKQVLLKGKNDFPVRFAVLSMTARKPDPAWVDLVGRLDRAGSTIPGSERSDVEEVMGKFINYSHAPVFRSDHGKKGAASSAAPLKRYAAVAKLYYHFQLREWPAVIEQCKLLNAGTSLLKPSHRQLLPFLVAAIKKSQSSDQWRRTVRGLLRREFLDANDFDTTLAKAVATGLDNKPAEALALFNTAFNHKPFTEDRLFFPWYTLVELLEFMHQETGDARYVDQALKWVKAYQEIQPMHGWAFAFEATYSASKQDRLKALAYAQYLDPQCVWIAHFSEAEKATAEKWFRANNPFNTNDVEIQRQSI